MSDVLEYDKTIIESIHHIEEIPRKICFAELRGGGPSNLGTQPMCLLRRPGQLSLY
jgi:hypothetical protein